MQKCVTVYFFRSNYLPRVISSSAIILVPKHQPSNTMSNFRPITCCNILYKCVTKLIVARLKEILPSLVSPYQSTFVPKRLMGDNNLFAQALCESYHLDSGQPQCAIKLDIKKAFENLNWNFFLKVLLRMGFSNMVVEWIMICIKSCMIFIKANGSLEGYFKAESGLRQGDPLSLTSLSSQWKSSRPV